MKTRMFSVLCQNVPGVMMRVSRTFTRRMINLDSITVGIEPSGNARIILIFKSDDRMAEFLHRVLSRAEPIIYVEVIEHERSIAREIALLKTCKLDEKRMVKVVQQVERAGGKVLDDRNNVLILEVSGSHEDIENIVSALGPDILKEVARSGQVLISRQTT